MTPSSELERECFPTTDGEIAVINLASARRRSWSMFFQNPCRDGAAETVLEHERLTAQFVGDVSALDRVETLAMRLAEADAGSARTALVQAQLASMVHRFAEARQRLAESARLGAPSAEIHRLTLNIDQADWSNLDSVLDQRREIAAKSGRLDDLVALGALLADLRDFTEADSFYRQALENYQGVSPFPVARVCFQLGVLWGELVPEPQRLLAERWYRRAVDCLPSYTKACVHLAEIYALSGRTSDAEAVLSSAIGSGDPEVRWRLADVMASRGRSADAEAHMQAARRGFDALLGRHLLAFADHAAEFYAGSGKDRRRALELARVNVANRPTLLALEQAHEIAVSAGDGAAASEFLADARKRWSGIAAFQRSPLANPRAAVQGAAA